MFVVYKLYCCWPVLKSTLILNAGFFCCLCPSASCTTVAQWVVYRRQMVQNLEKKLLENIWEYLESFWNNYDNMGNCFGNFFLYFLGKIVIFNNFWMILDDFRMRNKVLFRDLLYDFLCICTFRSRTLLD
jgi:hypothetical protein